MTPSLEDVDLTSGRRHSPCPRPAVLVLLYRLSGSERKRKGCPHTIRGPRGEAWLARRARAVAADGRAVAASRVVLCDAADRCGGTSEPRRGARRASTPRLGRRRYGPGRVDRIARARRPVPSQRHPGDKREQHPQQTAAPAVVLLLHPFQIIVCLIFYFKFDNSFYSENLYKYY